MAVVEATAYRVLTGVKKRSILSVVGSAAAFTLLGANEVSSRRIWRGKGPATTAINLIPQSDIPQEPASTNPKSTKTMGVIFHGFASTKSAEMAQQMRTTALGNQPWAYFDYGQRYGVTSHELATHLQQMKQELGITYADAYFHSMGIQKGLPAFRESGTKARLIVINSSPSGIHTAVGGLPGRLVAQYFPYDGGVIGRFAGSAIGSLIHRRHEVLKNAYLDISRGASTKLCRSDMKLLHRTKLLQEVDSYRKIIDPRITQAVYIASPNDRVVRTQQSYNELKEFFGILGVSLDYLEMPQDTVHADPRAIDTAQQWIVNALEKYGSGDGDIYNPAMVA